IAAWSWWTEDDSSRRVRSMLRFGVGLAPAVIGITWLNAVLYESPLTSGYGTAGDLYSLRYLAPNVVNDLMWMAASETPIVGRTALYLVALRMSAAPQVPLARPLIGGIVGVTVLSYAFYRPFDVWWYLRFLLPMWPVMLLATAATMDGAIARIASRIAPRRATPPVPAVAILTIIVALLVWHHIGFAESGGVFTLGRSERKYVDVARFVAQHTEPDAVVLSVQHSGSLRFYAGRLTLKRDVLDPAWLD